MTAALEPRLFALNVVDHPEAGSTVGIIAKRTYTLRRGICEVAEEQLALVEVPAMNDDASMLLHDLDTVLNRSAVDVIVTGHAYPPRTGLQAFDASVRVGSLQRQLRVFGERRCDRAHSGRARFRDAGEIEPVDLAWSSAYGGADPVTARLRGDPIERFCSEHGQPYNPCFGSFAYPRNRAGKGYLVEASDEALAACMLPQLEDPAQLLTPETLAVGRPDWWPAGPPVAALGWLSYNYFPRAAMVGLVPYVDAERFPADSLFEVQSDVLPAKSIAAVMPLAERVTIAVAQQAAVGMRCPDLPAAGAAVVLENLHPRSSTLSFQLPAERPQLLLQLPAAEPIELEAKIRTVHIEPDYDRISFVFVGEHQEPAFVGSGKRAHLRWAVKWAT
jgi:Uncharacterized protein conserved in bacteria (DUF2169)